MLIGKVIKVIAGLFLLAGLLVSFLLGDYISEGLGISEPEMVVKSYYSTSSYKSGSNKGSRTESTDSLKTLVTVGGVILSVFNSCLIYGFGELVENSAYTRDILYTMHNERKERDMKRKPPSESKENDPVQ